MTSASALGGGLVAAVLATILAGCAGGATASAPAATSPASTASAAAPSSAAGSAGTGGAATGFPVAAGTDLCGLLGPGDFAANGVSGAGAAKENNEDASHVYCVYAGTSSATGGIEFDAFLEGTKDASAPAWQAVSAPMLDFAGEGEAAFPDADDAKIRTDMPEGFAAIAIWQGKLVFDIGIPPSPTAKDQLIALAKVVLQRASALT